MTDDYPCANCANCVNRFDPDHGFASDCAYEGGERVNARSCPGFKPVAPVGDDGVRE